MCFRNFSQDEAVEEKTKKHNKVKGIKGLRTLLKGVASYASAGKHANKLIGSTSIPLKVWSLLAVICISLFIISLHYVQGLSLLALL
jgi:hypothetical protein